MGGQMSILSWLFTDKENAARGAAADAELRRIKDERIASGYYSPEQVTAIQRSYETDAYLNEAQAQQAINGAFWEGWNDGRKNVSNAITGTLNRVVADPLRAIVGGIPWWLWLVALGALVWYFQPLWSRVRKMFLLASLAALSISQGTAGQVRVAWEASPSTNVTAYVLYAHTNTLTETNLINAAVRVSVGTNLSASVLFTNTGRWHLVATARDASGVESEPSNQLVLSVPNAPAALATVAVEHTLSVSGSEWKDVGFFRLRIER